VIRKLGVFVALAVVACALAGSAGSFAGANGKILFLSNRSGDREIYLIDRDGTGLRRLTFNNLFERAAAWGPDGTKIAFAGGGPDGNFDIYVIEANGSGLRRLTTDAARDDDPVWTADGSQILYDRGLFTDTLSIRIVNADGTNDRALDVGPGNNFRPGTAPHGDRIVFASDRAGTFDLYTASLNGGRVRQITSGPGFDFDSRWSEGNDIAFLRDIGAGDNDLYVVHANGTGLRQLTATPTVAEFGPVWAPDNTEILFFAGGPAHIYAISPGGGSPTQLSTTPKAPLEENFDAGIRDSSLWHEIVDPGGTIGIQEGRLVASIEHDAVPGGQYNQVDEHWGSQCSLAGDYDFEVDWSLLNWPAHNGTYAALQAFFAGQGISRLSAPWDPPYDEQITSWTSASFSAVHSYATSGSFRLVRSGGTQFAYARTGASEWQLILATPADPGAAVYGMGLWAPGDQFAHMDVSVAFDNFRVNSGELTCPSWWSDAWPDWQAQ
jgi:Tol biopolymer transport system component